MIDIHDMIQRIRMDLFMQSLSREVQAVIATNGDHLIYGTLTAEKKKFLHGPRVTDLSPAIIGVMRKASIAEYANVSIMNAIISYRFRGNYIYNNAGYIIDAKEASDFLLHKMTKSTKIISTNAAAMEADDA